MDEEKGLTQIYCGPGKGKTSVAIGQAIRAVGYGKRAIVCLLYTSDAADD